MLEEREVALSRAIQVAPQWSTADQIVETAEKFLAFLTDEKNPPGCVVEISAEKAL